MAALIGFGAFMAIAVFIFVGVTCKNKIAKKLTPAEEAQFEIDAGDVSGNAYVLDLLHPEE